MNQLSTGWEPDLEVEDRTQRRSAMGASLA